MQTNTLTINTQYLQLKKLAEFLCVCVSKLITYSVVALITWVFLDILTKGLPALSWQFLTTMPVDGGASGGILPALLGTLLLIVISMTVALFLGVTTAIYLSEYAKPSPFKRWIYLTILTLSGVPSIVFGLFGLALFVGLCQLGPCALAGGLTLACMVLPTIIVATEETLQGIPKTFREASLALGATQWQTIWHQVLPYALPGILTGSVLAIGRVAGETAPIIFTAAAFFLPALPSSIFKQVMALPYQLYVLATQHPGPDARMVQYGIALVLLLLIFALNSVAFVIRTHYRKRYRW